MFYLLFWFSLLLILYIYVGYPVAIWVLALFHKPVKVDSSIVPTVTLFFAAHNEERVIAQKLENSLALDYPRDRLQILVADDGSSDRTVEIAGSFVDQGIKLISYPERSGKLAAIRRAFANVTGEIVLFSDSDNFYPADVLRHVVKYFGDQSVGGVSGGRNVIGKTSLGTAEGIYWKYEEGIKLHESQVSSCVGVAGDLLAIRSELYQPPPSDIINDDFFIAVSIIKQGYKVLYAPDARSFHPVATSEKGEIERRARMVAGRYQAMFSAWRMLPFQYPGIVWQIISHKYLRPFIPIAMFFMLIGNALALWQPANSAAPAWFILAPPYGIIVFVVQVVFYIMAILGRGRKYKGKLGKFLYLPAFLLNSNLAALLGLYRFMSERQTVMWRQVRDDL